VFVDYVFQVSAYLRPGHHFIDIHVILMSLGLVV